MNDDDQVDVVQLLAFALGATVAALFIVATRPRRERCAIDRRTGERLDLEQRVERCNDLEEELAEPCPCPECANSTAHPAGELLPQDPKAD